MTQNNASTTTIELTFSIPINLTAHSSESYLVHKPMSVLYHDEKLSQSVLHQIKVNFSIVSTYTKIFNNDRQFTSYLAGKLITKKIIFIICSRRAECIRKLVEERPECYRIYELQLGENKLYVQPNLDASRNVLEHVKEEFIRIKNDVRTIDDHRLSFEDLADRNTAESSSVSVFNSNPFENSFRYLSSESLKFLLFQSCIKVLAIMRHGPSALDEMVYICRNRYMDNPAQLRKIDHFCKSYTSTEAINYYTQDSFVFRRLSEAFRCEDIDYIYKLRSYVADLYKQIDERARSQTSLQSNAPLYRGKKLPTIVLQQLFDNKNKLISINGFMSTTRDIAVAKSFADAGQNREGYESALFKLFIDESTIVRSPFADIQEDSAFEDEAETLFTMGSVWLLERIEWDDDCWIIELRSSNALNSEIAQLKDLPNGCTFLSMGNILQELGQYANARNFYDRMLEVESLDNRTRGLVYYHMGLLSDEENKYMEALQNYLRAEELIPATELPIHSQTTNSRPIYAYGHMPSKLHICNNIARSYENKGDFEKARKYYTKGLGEGSDTGQQAIIHYNLGLLEYRLGNYEEARRCFINACQLRSDSKIIQNCKQQLNYIDAVFNVM